MNKPHPTSRAFTLIEILVAVALIVLLLGLGVAAISAMYGEADKSRTQVMLRQLQGVITEYGAHTKGSLPEPDNNIADVVDDIKSNGGDAAEMMLRSIDKRFWDGGSYSGPTGAQAILDAWDNEIEYVEADGSNGDTGNNMPARPRPYFASAGADGEWGSYTDNNIDEPNPAAKDNLFSFEVGQ
ncbi:MAG: prepilin-type N-terminal cleavage/methylation domain-containing protein [Planctomycetes bacterium]|jgi:prepilin-type N-terminal cleavage/methylation domain-containing protein|nr:prepilin-type N-terminal cleavage/methylation domain-containing protein [Planctomycetota bacterium]